MSALNNIPKYARRRIVTINVNTQVMNWTIGVKNCFMSKNIVWILIFFSCFTLSTAVIAVSRVKIEYVLIFDYVWANFLFYTRRNYIPTRSIEYVRLYFRRYTFTVQQVTINNGRTGPNCPKGLNISKKKKKVLVRYFKFKQATLICPSSNFVDSKMLFSDFKISSRFLSSIILCTTHLFSV